jgi:Fe-only nitrogenase accessory protein AnfO
MKIAVFMADNGRTVSLYEVGKVCVYEQQAAVWCKVNEIAFSINYRMPLADIRERTLAMLAQLHDCRHFIAREIHGALLSYFDGMGVSMWKLDGDPLSFFDAVRGRVEESYQQAQLNSEPTRFMQAGEQDGEYQLDLIAALRSDTQLTSKHVLLPFLRQVAFSKLEIICDHIPKWFEHELAALQLTWQVENLPDLRCHVQVTPQLQLA